MRFLLILSLVVPQIVFGQTTFKDATLQLAPFTVVSAESWGSGVSAEDYDGDGDIDFILSSSVNSNPILYINKSNHDGEVNPLEFEKVFFDFTFHTRAAVWFDYDGDHRLDLLFAGDCLSVGAECDQTLALFQQQADGSLIAVTEKVG